MKIAVTGGAGFIGSHIVDKLITYNHEVIVVDIKPPHRDDVAFMEKDLLDSDSLIKSFRNIDMVFHLAAVSNINNAMQDPAYTIKVNVLGTKNVLEAARINHLKRIILASTVWVYGNPNLYALTKIAAERLCQYYYRRYFQPFTILRYGIPYGPRTRDGLAISTFVRKALAGEPITIFGDGNQFRNFLYVEDLAIGNLLAMNEAAKNRIYDLDGDKKITIKGVIETIRRILGKDIKIEYREPRACDYFGKEVSSEKARDELGWEPKVSFEEGLRKYIAWVKEN